MFDSQRRTLICDIISSKYRGKCKEGDTVYICGWVQLVREMGGVNFLVVQDRSAKIQVVSHDTITSPAYSIVEIDGSCVFNKKAPEGIEIHAHDVRVISKPNASLPLGLHQTLSAYSVESLLNHRLFSLRNTQALGIFRVQSHILSAFESCMREAEFTEIKTSKLIQSGTEGGTGLFEVSYFDKPVYLTQSPQFYKQAAVASGLERVFEIGTAYRAEKHDTNRHLNEYVSLDVEMGFIDDEHTLMDLECYILDKICTHLSTHCRQDLALFNVSLPHSDAINAIPRISYEQAKSLIEAHTKQPAFDLNPAGEHTLCQWALKKHGIASVFVYGFPRRKRPFYTMPEAGNSRRTRSFDLLYEGIEITTGGLRIHDYVQLQETIQRFNLSEESLKEYLTIFELGAPPHGGFAIGLERLTQKILGLETVKLASMFPRDRQRTSP